MTDDFLTDQQQADRIKDWFRESGLFLIGGIVLGLAALFGWKQWQGYDRSQAEQASVVYEVLLDSANTGNVDDVKELVTELADKFGGSPYVDQGRLALARLLLDQNQPEDAAAQLRQVAEDGGTAVIRDIARLRLARVLVFQEKYDAALKSLRVDSDSDFAAAFHDVRGDAHYGAGQFDDARREYQLALDDPDAQGMLDRAYVQAKLDDLSTGTVSDAAPAAAPAAPAAEEAAGD